MSSPLIHGPLVRNEPAAPQPAARQPEAALPIPALLARLGASTGGLTAEEAARRLTQHGYNELVETQASPLKKFLSYFWGPIPWMIEIAAVLSLVVRHLADFAVIFALLVVNTLVGFWEEYQAVGARH
jgi:H+-transporting ATPase